MNNLEKVIATLVSAMDDGKTRSLRNAPDFTLEKVGNVLRLHVAGQMTKTARGERKGYTYLWCDKLAPIAVPEDTQERSKLAVDLLSSGLTQANIAELFNVSQPRVAQLCRAAQGE